jgi:hypothetical protein
MAEVSSESARNRDTNVLEPSGELNQHDQLPTDCGLLNTCFQGEPFPIPDTVAETQAPVPEPIPELTHQHSAQPSEERSGNDQPRPHATNGTV